MERWPLSRPVIGTDFKEMQSGNKVSRKVGLFGSQKIQVLSKSVLSSHSVIRGDLTTSSKFMSVQFGRFCFLGERSVVRPACKDLAGSLKFIPMTIGDYTTIGNDCVISASSIGSHVVVGDNVVVGKRCIIKDCAVIESGSVLAMDTVVPPFTVFGGNPAKVVGELPETWAEMQRRAATEKYNNFKTG
jgi:dynactin-5